jgi:probable F420-dependent oxidoreductase
MDVDPSQLVEIASLAEQAGFDSVWVNDHVVIPASFGANYPFNKDGELRVDPETAYADPLTTLAFVAGATSRVRLGVSVLVLPYRHPLDTAKRAATLDVLSRGRLILGVGIGWMREEFDALGVDFATRGRNFDEQLEIMRGAWTQGVSSYDGEIFSFLPVGAAPRPPKADGVEIWMGGHSAKTLHRACKYATAVHWIAEEVDEIERRRVALAQVSEESGLAHPLEITLRGRLALSDHIHPLETGVVAGPLPYLEEQLREYAAAGVSHFMIDRRKDGYDGMLATFEELAPVLDSLAAVGTPA